MPFGQYRPVGPGSGSVGGSSGSFPPAGGNLIYYAATTGSDSNPGTALSPLRTIQRAITLGLNSNYQSLYDLTINVADGTYNENVNIADGLLYGPHLGIFANGSIIGNVTNPANVVVQPTSGLSNSTIDFHGGFWYVDGITFVADQTVVGGSGFQLAVIAVENTVLNFGTINISSGTTPNADLGFLVIAQNYARFLANNLGAGTGNLTISGTNQLGSGGPAFIGFFANIFSTFSFAGISVNFSTNQGDLTGFLQSAFAASNNSIVSLLGTTFVNPSNWHGTALPPVQLSNEAALILGQDPTTVTWPAGTFDPKQIDRSSNIDGFFYAIQKAGLPANTDLYPSTWAFFKDTSGGGVYAVYNDAGTIKKVALT